jgi:outer membrane protein TolC
VVAAAAPASTTTAAPEEGPVEKVFTIDDAVTLALKNDSRLLSAEQDRIIAQERVTEAKLVFLPEFGLQASATKFGSRYPFALSPELGNMLVFPSGSKFNPAGSEDIYSGRGYMNFPIYEGGRSYNTLRLAQAALLQARSNYEAVNLEVILAVKEAFFRLLAAQEKDAAAATMVSEAQRMAAALTLDPWGRIEAEGFSEQSRHLAAESFRELTLRRLDFLKALNLEQDTAFRVTGQLEPEPVKVDPQKAALWAIELRPELKSETYKAEMDAIAVNLAISRRYPTLFLSGDYEIMDQRFPLLNNNWDVGAGIKLPLTYDFFTKLRQKRAEQRQGQLKRAALQDQVRLEVRQACEQLNYWELETSLRGQRYRTVSGIYEGASATAAASLAKLRALMTVIGMRLSYLEAVTEFTLARARLERAVGRDLAP